MRSLSKFLMFFVILFNGGIENSFASSNCNYNTHGTTENFLPVLRLDATPIFISDNSAIGLLGEIGPRSYRINGTYGFLSCNHHRFKIGGEFLGQKLHYKFSTGKVRQWDHQYAVGGQYQYLLYWNSIVQGFQLSGSFSRANSHSLPAFFCKNERVSTSRRLAGGDNWNTEVGLILTPWDYANLILTLGYDNTRYRRIYSHDKRVAGVSGSIYLNQRFLDCFAVDITAEFRRAYNYLEGMLSWNTQFCAGDVNIGIFGGYTWGKRQLPSHSVAGLEMRYAWNVNTDCCRSNCDESCELSYCDCGDLADWVACPAVYRPAVLAIPDESKCNSPTSTAFTGPLIFDLGNTVTNLTTHFSDPEGNNLAYYSGPLPPGVHLNKSGLLVVENAGFTPIRQTITVTAKSKCGSTSQNITIVLVGSA